VRFIPVAMDTVVPVTCCYGTLFPVDSIIGTIELLPYWLKVRQCCRTSSTPTSLISTWTESVSQWNEWVIVLFILGAGHTCVIWPTSYSVEKRSRHINFKWKLSYIYIYIYIYISFNKIIITIILKILSSGVNPQGTMIRVLGFWNQPKMEFSETVSFIEVKIWTATWEYTMSYVTVIIQMDTAMSRFR